ncbi:hypothetical protein MHYP_G00252970 [Metynnis hypsauchen]
MTRRHLVSACQDCQSHWMLLHVSHDELSKQTEPLRNKCHVPAVAMAMNRPWFRLGQGEEFSSAAPAQGNRGTSERRQGRGFGFNNGEHKHCKSAAPNDSMKR